MKKMLVVVCVMGAIAIFCFIIHSRPEVAAQAPTESETAALQRRIETFFDSITEFSDSTRAYQAMFQGTQTPDSEIQKMVQETNRLTKTTRWKFEHLDTKKVGMDIILVRYLYKSETYPVVWYFTFYRSQTGPRSSESVSSAGAWNCLGVKFNNDTDSLFKESWPK